MNNARYCRICLRSLDKNCYLLCKSTNDGLTAAGRALFLLTKIDSRAEVREDAPTRLCKSCYDLVLRVKKNDDDVAAKKESLKERLAKSRSFFFRTKHQREPSSPVPSRIPTPTRSPASKRSEAERRQRTSARKLTFAQPIQSTSDLPQPLPQLSMQWASSIKIAFKRLVKHESRRSIFHCGSSSASGDANTYLAVFSQLPSTCELIKRMASCPLRRKSLICVSISAIKGDMTNTAEGEACCLKASQR